MDVAKVAEGQNANGSCSSSTPDVLPPENHNDSQTHHVPRGTIIPNRIFVGGLEEKMNETDLRNLFSHRATVKDVKIVIDRSGSPKGYGFVTFETRDEAMKILRDPDGVFFEGRKLCIAQAVRKQQVQLKNISVVTSAMRFPYANLYVRGYPYNYLNGAAYCHCPNMNPVHHHWPRPAPVVLPQSHQSVCQQPSCYPYQCVPNQYQWNIQQSMPSTQAVYPQPPEYLHTPDGGSVQLPQPVAENTTPEQSKELAVSHAYQPNQRAEGMRPTVPQHDPGKPQMIPTTHGQPKPKYPRRHVEHRDLRYLPAAEPPDASMPHKSRPLM